MTVFKIQKEESRRKNKAFIEQWIAKADRLSEEYVELWNKAFMPRVDLFRKQMAERKKEMAAYLLTHEE